jgi:hypothetical protein
MVRQPELGDRVTLRLTVYVAAHCQGCAAAHRLVEQARHARPHWHISIVDLDTDGAAMRDYLIGTPAYVARNAVQFLGNPALDELLARLDALAAQDD